MVKLKKNPLHLFKVRLSASAFVTGKMCLLKINLEKLIIVKEFFKSTKKSFNCQQWLKFCPEEK